MIIRSVGRKLVLLAAAAIGAGFPALLTPTADAQDVGYQASCNRIAVIGATLEARCRRLDGSYQRTSIVLQGIENVDGQLQLSQPGQAATFQSSCRGIHVIGATLSARCRRLDGSYQHTSVVVEGISNIDGTLRYQ